MKQNFYNIGFYGIPNFGDELLCSVMVHQLQKRFPQCDISIMTKNVNISQKYTSLPVKYIKGYYPEKDYFTNLKEHISAVAASELVLIGGGGLFADYYSKYSIIRYSIDILWAITIGRPYAFVGLGVGKIRRKFLRILAGFVFRNAACIYCRDEKSAEQVYKLSGRHNVLTAPDLGNMLFCSSAVLEPQKEKPYALVNLRRKPAIEKDKVILMLNELALAYKEIIFFVAEKDDQQFYTEIIRQWKPKGGICARIVSPPGLAAGLDIIHGAEVVIAERLHVNLVAVLCKCPLLAIEYETKVEQFISMTGAECVRCKIDEIGQEPVRKLLCASRSNNKSMINLNEKTVAAFDYCLDKSMTSPKYTMRIRLLASLYLSFFLLTGCCLRLAVFCKRVIRNILKKQSVSNSTIQKSS